MSDWIPVPHILQLADKAEPYLIDMSMVDQLRLLASSEGAEFCYVNLDTAQSAGGVIDAIRTVLPLPEWCASNWDSIDEAFNDIRRMWTFPCFLVVGGLPHVMSKRAHLA